MASPPLLCRPLMEEILMIAPCHRAIIQRFEAIDAAVIAAR
jgi:hypothetical protein